MMMLAGAILGCGSSSTTTSTPPTAPVALTSANPELPAVVGTAFSYDATRAGAAFSGTGLRYTVAFTPDGNGLTASGGVIGGTPLTARPTTDVITVTDAAGRSVKETILIVAFAAGLPLYYTDPTSPGANVAGTDNAPAINPSTNAGATLGRGLFHDVRLSTNDRIACSSCHMQSHGFSGTA